MQLYLQFGFGMMGLSRELVDTWGGGTVILSPRDLEPVQLTNFAAVINGRPNGHVLLDPQFYLPHADHDKLCSHGYWPGSYSTGTFWTGPALTELISELATLNHELSCSHFILPGMLADTVNDDWLNIQEAILTAASSDNHGLPLLSTIALSADAARDPAQIAALLQRAETWNPYGYYVVMEHPNGSYLVDNPSWVSNVMDLVAGFRLRGAFVLMGYCNHQMLIAAAAKVNAIASGTWMNVRSFPPAKFQDTINEEIRRRATWYYCSQALSEYKLPYLDIAYDQGLLPVMAPPCGANCSYTAILFQGNRPTSVGYRESSAFKHYLHCLHAQVANAEQSNFDLTVAYHENLLNNAEMLLGTLRNGGIRGQFRDFTDIVDSNRSALAVLQNNRGAMLRHRWPNM